MSRKSVGNARQAHGDSERLNDIRIPASINKSKSPRRKQATPQAPVIDAVPPGSVVDSRPTAPNASPSAASSTSATMSVESPAPRKGASRIADIPPDVLKALNEGREESLTLVEYLAIDIVTLTSAILPDVGLTDSAASIIPRVRDVAMLSVTQRMRTMGHTLAQFTADRPDRDEIFERIANHRSDIVRAWAVYMIAADRSLRLADRLARTRRFAADRAMSVRESAWDSYRPFLAKELEPGIDLLTEWVNDSEPSIRRCAVESTRPRGVWTAHIERLKLEPAIGLPLLEPLRADPNRYVQTAVGNWLNDASKSRPEWVTEVCDRWWRESHSPHTEWIIHHATRTIRKGAQ